MNNFPAMTDERRQLAALCKIEIKRWQAASESNPNMRYMVELMEIALAALTAEPVAYTDAEELETLRKGSFADMFTPHEAYKEDPLWMPLYTSPPAPVLRVPDGWKLVPIQPTEAMMLHESGCQHHAWDDANCPMRESRRIIWKHMIEAAPEVD
ncbi:hypothetical protein [Pantoea dispersa]|uniref:hypothetical protein n=1 Tax=Pantoea dispersa TaxID=59814 RepID=UPI0021C91AD0|nr:hypothetical protein [Pantoea dispersa]UXO69951.1 hypothetical protein N7977_08110 [Pantoea dispersa]